MQERSAPQENGKSPAAASRSGKRSPGSNANTSVQSTRRPLTSSEGFPPPAVANQAGIPLTTTPKRHPKPNPAKTPETSVMKILMPATKSPLNITSLNVGGKLVEFNLSPVKGEYLEFAKIPAAMKSNGFKPSKEAEDIMRTPTKKTPSRVVPISNGTGAARRPQPLFSSHSAAALSTPPNRKGNTFVNQCIAQSAPGRYSHGNLGAFATPPRMLQRQHSVNVASLGPRAGSSRNGQHRYSPPGTFHNTPEADLVVPPLFAGSKFLDSPQAKKLPPPPRQWLDDLKAKSISSNASSDEEGARAELSSNSTSPTSQLSSISGTSMGVRFDPLTLIAVCARS